MRFNSSMPKNKMNNKNNCIVVSSLSSSVWPMVAMMILTLLLSMPMPTDGFITTSVNSNRAIIKSVSLSSRLFMSDVPRDDKAEAETETEAKKRQELQMLQRHHHHHYHQKSWRDRLPPPPEDQVVLMGDLMSLFVYALSSHYLSNMMVQHVLDTSDNIHEAIKTLDPAQEIINRNLPVWLDQPHMADQILSYNVQSTMMTHWGPLFSTAGAAYVSLCSCWLLAGWIHQAFLFKNTLDCETTQALTVTLKTWLTATFMLTLLSVGCNELVAHVPALQHILGCSVCQDFAFTQSDVMYIVDSLSVLIVWRFIASWILGFGL